MKKSIYTWVYIYIEMHEFIYLFIYMQESISVQKKWGETTRQTCFWWEAETKNYQMLGLGFIRWGLSNLNHV